MIHICLLEGNGPNAGPIQQVVVYILKKGTQKIICTKQAIFKTLHVTISATTAVELHAIQASVLKLGCNHNCLL